MLHDGSIHRMTCRSIGWRKFVHISLFGQAIGSEFANVSDVFCKMQEDTGVRGRVHETPIVTLKVYYDLEWPSLKMFCSSPIGMLLPS